MNEYWRQREEQARREYQLTEEEYIEQLNGIYDYMLDRINEDIRSFYSRYATREGITYAEATERVSNTVIEEYERKAKKYVEEHDFSAQANEEMRIYNLTMRVNRLETLKAEIGLEMVDGFNELDTVLGEDLTERAVQEMARQSGILGMTVKDTARTANSIVGASFHNATFSERIWMYQDELKSQLDILLRQGLIQGRGPRELADQILKRFDVSRNEAERLMRTELCRVQTEAQKQSFIANGFDEYQYNALSTACPVCRALDEKHFKIVDMMPGENAPPMHPNCFCATSAYMDDATYNEWLDTYQNHGMSYEDWLNNRPTAVEAETNHRNYDCDLAQKLGREHYDKLHDIIDACEDEELKNLWYKYEDKIIVGDAKYNGRAHESHGSIYLNIDRDALGSSYQASYETLFHEASHAIDFYVSRGSGIPAMGSTIYEDGAFLKSLQSEVNGLVNSKASAIKQDFKDYAGDWEYLVDKGYISKGQYNFYLRQGEWPYNKEPTYSKSMAYAEVEKELKNIDLLSVANMSDITEGVTRCRVQAGVGHSAKYWKNQNNVSTEAFAEFSSASYTNDGSLEVLKQYLPNSYEVWHNMVKEMAE